MGQQIKKMEIRPFKGAPTTWGLCLSSRTKWLTTLKALLKSNRSTSKTNAPPNQKVTSLFTSRSWSCSVLPCLNPHCSSGNIMLVSRKLYSMPQQFSPWFYKLEIWLTGQQFRVVYRDPSVATYHDRPLGIKSQGKAIFQTSVSTGQKKNFQDDIPKSFKIK